MPALALGIAGIAGLMTGCQSENEAEAATLIGATATSDLTRATAALASVTSNLITDPGFESGMAGFSKQTSTDSLTRTSSSPISGRYSLRVNLKQWGSNVWWSQAVTSATSYRLASKLTVSAKTRGITTKSTSPLQICAVANYADNGSVVQSCANAPTTANVTQTITANLTLDSKRALSQIAYRITLDGATPVVYLIDDASIKVTTPSATPSPRPSTSPSPSPTVSPSPSPTVSPSPSPTVSPSPSPTPTVSPSPSPTPTVSPSPSPTPTVVPSGSPVNLSAVWANDGGDKVAQEDTRASTSGAGSVANSVWNGSKISIFGAKNEVVNFNLVLEAATKKATNVSVTFDTLTGPGGATIASVAPANNDGVFNYTQRNIENFFVRYLEIKGLSLLSYETYDERHIPKAFRRPWTGSGTGSGSWADRPDHNKHYPDIAVPLELDPTFDINLGDSQSVWSDIYIPKTATAGTYTGIVTVKEGSNVSYQVPVELVVRGFTLPDAPASKTMVYVGTDMNLRYTGQAWPNDGTSAANALKTIKDRHFQMAHRHKVALIDADGNGGQPSAAWIPRLNGQLFTSANGYAGPGAGVGNDIYSIGTYGSWNWQSGGQSAMWSNTNAWESWFKANSPSTERFLYLIDESSNYAQIEQWAQWANSNTGTGKDLRTFATIPLTSAQVNTPSLDIAASWFTVGDTASWTSAVNAQLADSSKRYYQYNGKRPSQGSFATDDDGVALRELSWAQYKKGIHRWFFWESTYYNDFQGGRGQTDVFSNAATFSGSTSTSSTLGETGWNHSNGDGLLFYPGTDTVYPSQSYNVAGPIASLRLKHWRRGIQDVDYLTLAKAINPSAVQALVNQMVPKAFWDYGIADAGDPTWVRTDISWSINPTDWENARKQLAHIIDGQ